MENASQYVIEMLHITKEFPGIKANDDITLQLKKGEIHALLGENGAGKSTLMSVLFGMYQPEEGAYGVLKRLEELASLTEEETERMRRSAWEHWIHCCCSSALLPALFPEAAKKGGKGQ